MKASCISLTRIAYRAIISAVGYIVGEVITGIMQNRITLLKIGGNVHYKHTNKSGSRTLSKSQTEARCEGSKGQI